MYPFRTLLAASSQVGAPARKHAEDVDGALVAVEPQEDPPVAHAQPMLIATLQLDDVAGRRVADQAVERVADAPADRWVDAAQVAPRGGEDREAPAGGQPSSCRISSSGTA